MSVITCPHGRHRSAPCPRCHTREVIVRTFTTPTLTALAWIVALTLLAVVLAVAAYALDAPARDCARHGGTWDGGVCASDVPLPARS